MKTSLVLALLGFVIAFSFSVAVTENELADIADEFEAEKLRGGYEMEASDGEFDEEDLEDEDMVIPAVETNDMISEDEQFDERAFDNEVSDEDDARAIEKSADPIRLKRFRRRIGRRVRGIIRRIRRPIRRVRSPIRRRRGRRPIRRFRRG